MTAHLAQMRASSAPIRQRLLDRRLASSRIRTPLNRARPACATLTKPRRHTRQHLFALTCGYTPAESRRS